MVPSCRRKASDNYSMRLHLAQRVVRRFVELPAPRRKVAVLRQRLHHHQINAHVRSGEVGRASEFGACTGTVERRQPESSEDVVVDGLSGVLSSGQASEQDFLRAPQASGTTWSGKMPGLRGPDFPIQPFQQSVVRHQHRSQSRREAAEDVGCRARRPPSRPALA